MDALLKLAKKEKLDELESAWMLAVEEGSTDVDVLLEAAEVLVERGHRAQAESLLWYLAGALQEDGEPEAAFRAARRGAMLLPESRPLRDVLLDLSARVLEDVPGAEQIVQVTVGDEGLPLDRALAALDGLIALGPGSYVYDVGADAVGCVRSVDTARGGLVVEFEDGDRVVPPGEAGTLEILPDDDFRALNLFDRDRLRCLAQEAPEELVSMVLRAVDRRMELRRLRIYLEPVVDSWGRWWSGTRDRLKRSAEVGMTSGRSPSVFLRRKPLTHQERLLRRFRGQSEATAAARVALEALREARAHADVAAQLVAPLAEGLRELVVGCPDGESWRALPAAAVFDALRREFPERIPTEAPEVGGPLGPAAESLSRNVQDEGLLVATLRFIRRRFPEEWPGLFARMMPSMPRQACRVAGDMLAEEAPETLAEACESILSRSGGEAGALTWLWRRRTGAEPPAPIADLDAISILFRLLSAGTSIVRDASLGEERRKSEVAQIRSALLLRDGAALEAALEEASPDQLAPLTSMVQRNPALTPQIQGRLMEMLARHAPALVVAEVPPWEQDVIYNTARGIEKRKAELERVVHVRLPQVIRELGQAAQLGDISDNADYQSALRERGRLAELAERMREEISRARPITPSTGGGDCVTVGSRVTARNLATGQQESFTFLGPWDADLAEGIYGYDASLGKAFMGKKVGDVVSFRRGAEERRWEILDISPAELPGSS